MTSQLPTSNSILPASRSTAIPHGYKQTEVGVIPKEWNASPLKGKISIAHGFPFASEYFTDHGSHRLTTPGHFYEAGGFRDIGEKQKYYDGPVPSDYVLCPGNLIVAMTEQADGLLGSAAVIPNAQGYLHNQRLGRVKTLAAEAELGFMFYVFNSPHYRAKVRETAAGTKVKHTSPEKLLEISVPWPPAPEQRAIAGALSDVDALLGALDQLIAKKRDLKLAAMQQLLTGQTRLPGFRTEWVVKSLSQVCWFQEGPGVRNTQFTASGIKLLNGTNIFRGVLDLDTTNRFISEKEGRGAYAHFLADEGDIVLASSGITVERLHEKVAFVRVHDLPFCMNTSTIRFKPLVGVLAPHFLFQFLTSDSFKRMIGGVATGSAQLNFGPSHVAKIDLSVPPFAEQTAIAEVLSDMDAELAALEQRRAKTRALKQGMMQELLTGRTRLVPAQDSSRL